MGKNAHMWQNKKNKFTVLTVFTDEIMEQMSTPDDTYFEGRYC